MKFDEFEKIIISDIIEQYPEHKQKLQSQFKKIPVQKREFSTYGFSTYYVVTAGDETLGDDENLQLSPGKAAQKIIEEGYGFSGWDAFVINIAGNQHRLRGFVIDDLQYLIQDVGLVFCHGYFVDPLA